MNHRARAIGNLEQRIHDAERNLFAAVGADVDEFVLELAQTGLRVRVLSHGRGVAVLRSPSPHRVYRHLLAQGLGRPTQRPRRTR